MLTAKYKNAQSSGNFLVDRCREGMPGQHKDV